MNDLPIQWYSPGDEVEVTKPCQSCHVPDDSVSSLAVLPNQVRVCVVVGVHNRGNAPLRRDTHGDRLEMTRIGSSTHEPVHYIARLGILPDNARIAVASKVGASHDLPIEGHVSGDVLKRACPHCAIQWPV